MSHEQSRHSKNRRLIPQKVRHFFSTFPDCYEISGVPDWLLHRSMGSVWCIPKTPRVVTRGNRNRVEPESPHVALAQRRHLNKKPNKVANLTYKNTWSSFLKTCQSDQVKLLAGTKPPSRASSARPSVRFHRSSDPVDPYLTHRKSRSSSPQRRRSCPSSTARNESRKYLKIEAKALREAWLNEDIFPNFGVYDSRHRYRFHHSVSYWLYYHINSSLKNQHLNFKTGGSE